MARWRLIGDPGTLDPQVAAIRSRTAVGLSTRSRRADASVRGSGPSDPGALTAPREMSRLERFPTRTRFGAEEPGRSWYRA
jgi:hypothetical protein